MNEHKYTFVEPERDRRKRHERMKQLLKIEAGSERATALASLAREFHDHREINLGRWMHPALPRGGYDTTMGCPC
ncbi:MAG: hypothetical protein ACR2HR_08155 [Euzebya sp.]